MKHSISMTLLLLVSLCSIASAHPADGFEPKQLKGGYIMAQDAYPALWSQDDLLFMQAYPDPETLTDTEKYIIAGVRDSEYGHSLKAWSDEIFAYIWAYEARTGEVPTEFSAEYFNANMTSSPIGADGMEKFRNPVTGDWPSFNDYSAAPGAVYVRTLTDDEMEYYAELAPHYQDAWFNSRARDADSESYSAGSMHGPVFYMRIYGESGNLIFTQLMFRFSIEQE